MLMVPHAETSMLMKKVDGCQCAPVSFPWPAQPTEWLRKVALASQNITFTWALFDSDFHGAQVDLMGGRYAELQG